MLLLAACQRSGPRPPLPAPTLAEVQPATVTDRSCRCQQSGECAMFGDAIYGRIEARKLSCARPARPDDVYDCRWETRFIAIYQPEAPDEIGPWQRQRRRLRRFERGWCSV